jgi:rubredoxin
MTRYQCPCCEWIGTENDMEADWFVWDDEGDEIWSNWICPSCNAWHQLEDYKKVEE